MRDATSCANHDSHPLITGASPRWGFSTSSRLSLFPHGSPVRTSFSVWLSSLVGILCCISLLLTGMRVEAQAPQQGEGQQGPTGMAAKADVIVLIMPQSADLAQIALVYDTQVPQDRVRHEVDLLVKGFGGKLGKDLKIETKSLQPNDLKRFKVRTGASFTLLNSPQVRDSAPILAPYLAAFQSWDHVELLFWLPEINPYNGVEKFENAALTVQVIKDPGVYRYEVDIREHQKPLPTLTTERKEPAVTSNSVPGAVSGGSAMVSEKPVASSNSLPLALFLAGCALTAGVCIYLVMTRRSPVRVSPRSARR